MPWSDRAHSCGSRLFSRFSVTDLHGANASNPAIFFYLAEFRFSFLLLVKKNGDALYYLQIKSHAPYYRRAQLFEKWFMHRKELDPPLKPEGGLNLRTGSGWRADVTLNN